MKSKNQNEIEKEERWKVIKDILENCKIAWNVPYEQYNQFKLAIREGFNQGSLSKEKEMLDDESILKIKNNLNTSFFGTFEDALKNGYEMDKHYVIIDWIFFHKLLKDVEERLQKLKGASND